jgi:hypothetical protein
MATHLKSKRDALIAKLRQDFSLVILMIAMGAIKARRAGQQPTQEGEPETFFKMPVVDADQELTAFLEECSIRQLKMFREIAQGIGPGEEVTDPAELAMVASMQRKQ